MSESEQTNVTHVGSSDLLRCSGLKDCTKRIHRANDGFRKSFVQWIQTVGKELRKGQELLGAHKAGFERWCKDEFGWTPQHARRLVDAEQTMRIIEPMGSVKYLPDSERQCRELQCVPEDDLPEVWKQVCEHADESREAITAKVIRRFTEHYRGESNGNGKPTVFDEDKAGDRLRDWLRSELAKWPDKYRQEAAHWIRQILEKEFNL